MNLKKLMGNKKSRLCDFSNRGTETTLPSHISDTANVEINIETATENLKKIKKKYNNISKPIITEFISDIRESIGLPEDGGITKYGFINVNDNLISVRLANHNANANNYLKYNSNYPNNVSIVIKKKKRNNKFIPNDNVNLKEYVYMGGELSKIENPYVKIIDTIINFLQSGEFNDLTGCAKVNISPMQKEVEEEIDDSLIIYYDSINLKRITF